jgi:hypothetical protein
LATVVPAVFTEITADLPDKFTTSATLNSAALAAGVITLVPAGSGAVTAIGLRVSARGLSLETARSSTGVELDSVEAIASGLTVETPCDCGLSEMVCDPDG